MMESQMSNVAKLEKETDDMMDNFKSLIDQEQYLLIKII
jgi:hypothetical protein